MKYISLLATAALICSATVASSDTITFGDLDADFQYEGHGEAVGDTPITFDFIGSFGFDSSNLDAPDGLDDLFISDTFLEIASERQLDSFDRPILQFGGFAYSQNSPFGPVMFENGDVVESDFSSYTFQSGPLNIADVLFPNQTAIFGFVMDFAEIVLPDVDDPVLEESGFPGDPEGYCLELPFACNSVFESYFGWVQVTRGSVVPGYIGFNPTANQGAVVNAPLVGTPPTAAIPLPAGGWLLIAGLGGLAALRRRQRA